MTDELDWFTDEMKAQRAEASTAEKPPNGASGHAKPSRRTTAETVGPQPPDPSPEQLAALEASIANVDPPPRLPAEFDHYPDAREDPGFEPGDVDPARLAQVEAEQLAQQDAAWREMHGPAIVDQLGIRNVGDLSADAPAPLLIGRLDPEGHTIAYGTGGVGKGTLAAWWIVQLVAAGETVLITDYEAHPSEWARRIVALGGRDVARGVFYVSPTSAEWAGRRGAIWEHADELRQAADAVGATYVAIDSIVVACGAVDPLKPEAPGQYQSALALIGRPALSLAHVTKGEDLRYPFGSAFWHNLARVTWSLGRQSTGDGGHSIVLASRKSNNYARQGKHIVQIMWWEGAPREVSEQPYAERIGDLAADVLADGPLTVRQVTDRLNEELDEGEAAYKPNSVGVALRRGLTSLPKRFTVTGTGDRALYALAEEAVT